MCDEVWARVIGVRRVGVGVGPHAPAIRVRSGQVGTGCLERSDHADRDISASDVCAERSALADSLICEFGSTRHQFGSICLVCDWLFPFSVYL